LLLLSPQALADSDYVGGGVGAYDLCLAGSSGMTTNFSLPLALGTHLAEHLLSGNTADVELQDALVAAIVTQLGVQTCAANTLTFTMTNMDANLTTSGLITNPGAMRVRARESERGEGEAGRHAGELLGSGVAQGFYGDVGLHERNHFSDILTGRRSQSHLH
jgi:hypothetical protein